MYSFKCILSVSIVVKVNGYWCGHITSCLSCMDDGTNRMLPSAVEERGLCVEECVYLNGHISYTCYIVTYVQNV